jgi:hypothetical protein
MPELGPYGSVRGARGNSRPYRESSAQTAKVTRLTQRRHRSLRLSIRTGFSPINAIVLNR